MNKFHIKRETWNTIIDYARIAYNEYKSEIGGMSIIYKDNDSDWTIARPVILKQEISASNTSIDKDELAKYYTKEAAFMQKNYPKVEYRFLWWHSHHTMGAFWSGTDHKAIDEFSDGDMSFALVVNLKEEYKFRVSLWKPLKIAQDVDLNIIDKEASKLSKEMIKEVKDLCEEETRVTYLDNYKTRYNSFHYGTAAVDVDDLLKGKEELIVDQASYDPEFGAIVTEIGDICDKFVDGTLKYAKFSKSLKNLNKVLDKINSYYRIKIPSKTRAYQDMLTCQGPWELLIEDNLPQLW